MDNWDDLKFLLAVDRTGTMVAAGNLLGANVATVSRRIERLGEHLGAPLFIKTAGVWRLNPDAAGLLEIAEKFDSALKNELSQIRSKNDSAMATCLRVGAPPFISSRILSPRIIDSFDQNPDYSIELHDRANGAGLGDMDILLRAGRPESGRLITRKVGTLAFRLYRHRHGGSASKWAGLTEEFKNYPPMIHALEYFQNAPCLRTTQLSQLYRLAKSSRLSAPLPDLLAGPDPDFTPLEPDADPICVDIWVAYHSSRKTDRAIQDTVAWISTCFQSVCAPAPLEETA